MELIDKTRFLSDMRDELENDVNMYSSHIEKEIRDDKYEFVIDCIKERPAIDLFSLLYGMLNDLIAGTKVDLENSSGIFKEYEYRTRIDTLEAVKEIIRNYERGIKQ